MRMNHRWPGKTWPIEDRPLIRFVGRVVKFLLLHLFGVFIAALIASAIGSIEVVAMIWGFLNWSIPRVAMLTLCLLGATALFESNR
jgi:hypothetical protein